MNEILVELTGEQWIVGLTGKKRSGKDTVADIIQKHYLCERIAFAEALKCMAYDLNPVVDDPSSDLAGLVDTFGWDTVKEKVPGVREFLQFLGTDICRKHLGEDVWVNVAMERAYGHLSDGKSVVFTDVRFPNEAAMCDAVISVCRPEIDDSDTHVSETAMNEFRVAATIVNDGTLEDLEKSVIETMGSLNLTGA